MNMRSRLVLFLIILMITGSLSAQDFGRRERTYDVRHIRIEVAFDLEQKKVFGTVTTTISSLRPDLREIALDAVNMTIHDVEIDGKTVPFS
ncbi:MAG: M1 family metallopeptidase, partial [Chlorobi bacterium]|nr:M1 family metallopeptidase [Chlorobiota bacterium]